MSVVELCEQGVHFIISFLDSKKKKSGRSGSVSGSSSSSRSATPTQQPDSNQVMQHSGRKSKDGKGLSFFIF